MEKFTNLLGQTMSLSHIAPFVRISKEKIIKNKTEEYTDLGTIKLIKQKDFDRAVEKELKKEIKDAVQTFNYQINTISGTQGQTPFLSLVMYANEEYEYKEETILLIEEFLKQRIAGMENEHGVVITQTFPKLLYFLDEDNLQGQKYEYLTKLAAESTAKRLSPDYISVKKMKELYGHAYGPMGCRAFLTPWVNPETGEYDMYGRGNIGVATVNLVDAALSAEQDLETFFEILENRLNIAKEIGLFRYNKLKGVKANVAPIMWQHGAVARLNADDDIIDAIDARKFTVSIGYIGLHETVQALIGKSLTSEEGQELGQQIMQYLESYKDRAKEETGLWFAVYG